MIYTYWHTLALHDALPFFQRVFRAAILLDNCAILRHVDKAASQIARIRRLERRVGKALAGAVRRVEILEDGEAFLKVRDRSEEHTSELQSLMRISYAVFCLKKKKKQERTDTSIMKTL